MMRDFGIVNSGRDHDLRVDERCIDSQLWHACAGSIVQIPSVNSKVYYFPQGHAEHAQENVDLGSRCRIPPLILCKVASVKYMAEPETDELFTKIKLIPLRNDDVALYDEGNRVLPQDKSVSFAKTLTQSDANNGGGFSVPRFCAETIFPPLDFSAETPLQIIFAKDVHGEVWKFRHIYRGTPRRHLLTTGWSNFVNKKKLVAGDSIVFMRTESGDLLVGIKRAKRGGIGCPYECPSGWIPYWGNRAYSASVVEAATLASSGEPFEIVYYPRLSSPEFFVSAAAVKASMLKQWHPGMRFKMAFETEDSSRISWFMGTISSVQEADPIRWPNSPWRILQVAWDEPNLLQNVKRVSPWLVELVEEMPAFDHLLPFSPSRKKMRLPQPQDFSPNTQIPLPSFKHNPYISNSPICCLRDEILAGIQGARHALFGLSSPDVHLEKTHPGLFSVGVQHLDHSAAPSVPKSNFVGNSESNEIVSCLLTIGSSPRCLKANAETKASHILLFGKLIYAEGQSSSDDDTSGNSSLEGNVEKALNVSDGIGSPYNNGMHGTSSDEGSPCYKQSNHGLETGHCKVFINSEDVGWTVDLSVLGSYEKLYEKLANKFDTNISKVLGKVLYCDAEGAIKQTGDESYNEFLKTARKLNILMERS